jgi:hypothetical protein
MDEERAVSWKAIGHRAVVVNAAGDEIGHVDFVLGEDDDDIFHGLAIDLKGWDGHVELPADRVQRITTEKVYTDLGTKDADELKPYEPDRWFELKGPSRFRKKAKWKDEDRGSL